MGRDRFGVLFVCLGNICRSPLAEGIFRRCLEERGLDELVAVDSCGTGSWHVGEPPHHESQRVAKKNGISLASQRARQLAESDFEEFDLIVAMDEQNRRDVVRVFGREEERIFCLREYDPEQDSLDVPDPYYGGPEGFDQVFAIITRSLQELCSEVENRVNKRR